MARSQRRCRFRPQPLLGALLVLGACQRTAPDEAPAKPAAADEALRAEVDPPAPHERADEPRWRTGFAFDERIRGDGASDRVQATPLIEVIDHIRGDARTVFAVHRQGTEPSLRIEHWRFSARGPAGMSATGDPEPLLRLQRDDPPAEGLQDFRVFAAIPGNKVLRRESGLDSVDALLAELAGAAATVRNDDASGTQRVAALSELVAALDDALVLERDVLYRVLDSFAAGPPELLRRDDLSARRARLLIDGGRGSRQIEALKLQGGWVLRDFRLPPTSERGARSGEAPSSEPSPESP